MDGAPNARIRAAAADSSGHCFVNVLVRWFGIFVQENSRTNDLAGLAVTALRHVDFNPGALQWVGQVLRETFNCGDVLPGNPGQRRHARANGVAVKMDGARSTQSHAAPKFCACHSPTISYAPHQSLRAVIAD